MSTPTHKLKKQGVSALLAAGLKTVEAAAEKSDEELLAIKGVGAGCVRAVREFMNPTAEAELTVEGAPSGATLKQVTFDDRESSGFFGPSPQERRALQFFDNLCERASPTPDLVRLAWRLADYFEQEQKAAALGHPVILVDGMEVLFNDQRCVLRTTLKAGEPPPPQDQIAAKVILVKAG